MIPNSIIVTKSLAERQSWTTNSFHGRILFDSTQKSSPYLKNICGRGRPGQASILSLRGWQTLCNNKLMPDDDRPASAPASGTRAPDMIFTNWREMLHRLRVG
jgi:hypothetical protein